MKFLNTLEELPLNCRVGLYGVGEGSWFLKRRLEKERKDIEVICYIDDFKRGERDGIKVVDFENIQRRGNEIDLILITSAYWRDMRRKLESYQVHNYITVNPFLMFQNQIFTEEEERIYGVYFEKVKNLLTYERDKRLYHDVIKSRSIRQDKHELYEYFKNDDIPKEKEYLEFINKAHIVTIIEGGVLEGERTVSFLHFLPKGGVIYGFEPFYQAYLESKHKTVLDKFPNVKIFQLALWQRKDKIKFLENEYNKPASKVITDGNASDKAKYVDAISIDEFVKEQAIERVDFITLDVEGSELPILKGAVKTLDEHRPQLAISIYHNKKDLFEVPLFLDSLLVKYRYRIGHYSSTFWDTIWYAIPNEVPD